MIIIRYNKSARIVSYRILSRFLETYSLSMVQVSDANEHYHAIVDNNNNLVGYVEYKASN